MSVKFRPCAHGISVTLLVLLLEPQSLTAQFGPPCCTSPHSKWAMGFLADLDRQPDMQFDVESAWLLDQFNKLDQSSLVVVGAALDGFCKSSCPRKLAIANAAAAAVLSERAHTDERRFKWGDRWFGLLCAAIAAVATLVGTAAIITFSRAESRNEKSILALVHQLSLRNAAAQQGAPADLSAAASQRPPGD